MEIWPEIAAMLVSPITIAAGLLAALAWSYRGFSDLARVVLAAIPALVVAILSQFKDGSYLFASEMERSVLHLPSQWPLAWGLLLTHLAAFVVWSLAAYGALRLLKTLQPGA